MSDVLLEEQRFLKAEKVTSTPVALIAGSIGGATQVLVYVSDPSRQMQIPYTDLAADNLW